MATITKVARKNGDAYKAVIRLRGIKPFSKTFRRKTDARAWAERMERNIEEASTSTATTMREPSRSRNWSGSI